MLGYQTSFAFFSYPIVLIVNIAMIGGGLQTVCAWIPSPQGEAREESHCNLAIFDAVAFNIDVLHKRLISLSAFNRSNNRDCRTSESILLLDRRDLHMRMTKQMKEDLKFLEEAADILSTHWGEEGLKEFPSLQIEMDKELEPLGGKNELEVKEYIRKCFKEWNWSRKQSYMRQQDIKI